MTTFFRLMDAENKEFSLKKSITELNKLQPTSDTHVTSPDNFLVIPGASFAYWVSDSVISSFNNFSSTESDECTARQGLATSDDFRFLRAAWEIKSDNFPLFAKGGEYARYYSDPHLKVNWGDEGAEIKALICQKYPYLNGAWGFVAKNTQHYQRPGLTWSRRSQKGLSMRVMPQGCVFADKGPALFVDDNNSTKLLAYLAVVNSCAYKYLVDLQMSFGSYEVGVISKTPMPNLSNDDEVYLSDRARMIWSIQRKLDAMDESSHAFLLPKLLINENFVDLDVAHIEIQRLQNEIDEYCFALFNFNSGDEKLARLAHEDKELKGLTTTAKEDMYDLISWAVGVIFGRFNIEAYRNLSGVAWDVQPFEPLEDDSPGMLSENGSRYFNHNGMLTSNNQSTQSLQRLVDELLSSIGQNHSLDLDKWFDKEFFNLHLKKYSKSRRQAPLYLPLKSVAGSSTVWLYFNEINNQTLVSVVVDFVDPQLDELKSELANRMSQASRSAKEESIIDQLTETKSDLDDFRNELLRISTFWQPALEDGVQITMAPLWRLFQHTSWQKKLKQTWEKLQDGDYDWAHLAYTTWPERVLKKCHADRSIAIAHGVEADLWHEVEVFKGKKKEPVWEWQPKPLSPAELNDYLREKIATDERLALYRSNAKSSGVKS
ncbi:hypothetical protein [Photobacterium leiognathi]|uniref:hypothetical protein n=1 Tax=Photobacterium leiognathi TaxID=553611 RepID=UPI003AF3622F